MKILLVEDDPVIAELLGKALREQNYTVDIALDGQTGWELVEFSSYDALLLDVMLPKLDGISFCRRLRNQGNLVPVILLTAQDTSTNKVMGLDAGADDYVVKPFDFDELLARIRALLRRGGSALPPLLVWDKLQLDPSTCEVRWDGNLLHLTPKEYGLLEVFLRNNHRIYSCGALIEQLWSFEEPPTEDTVRSHLKGLRQKLKGAGIREDPIETVYGIGYRLKPVEQTSKQANKAERKSITTADSKVEAETVAGVSEIWQQVKQTLYDRVKAIATATTMLQNDQLTDLVRKHAALDAHKLVGSLGMFGSDEGSCKAKEIERLLTTKLPLDLDQKQNLTQLVEILHQELQRLDTEQQPQLEQRLTNEADLNPLLLVIDQDGLLAEDLALEADTWGIRVLHFNAFKTIRDQNITELFELIERQSPDVVLINLTIAKNYDNAMAVLAELNTRLPNMPAIALTAKDNLIDRVKIARMGGRRILQTPVSPAQVMETASQLVQNARTMEARVMAVDDDPLILIAIQTLLEPWGIKVFTLDNPLRFLDALETAAPELLILDVEMPQISGIDLCQVVRNDPNWSGLPVLFLTAHSDIQTKQKIFAAGADDFVTKPIVGPELVTRILNRLERSRLLRSLSDIDPLTLVFNRRKSSVDLEQLLQRCSRISQQMCFAIVKPNNIKQINHQHGPAAGDRVLALMGKLLRRTFHSEYTIGRWSGIEFAVGMSAMTKSDGKKRLSELLKSLRQLEFTDSDGAPLKVAFSGAIAQYPKDGTDLQTLYQTVLKQLKKPSN